MCNACVSWENVESGSVTIADLLAFDALPHDVRVICVKKIAHEIESWDDMTGAHDETEKAERLDLQDAATKIEELGSRIEALQQEISNVRDDREQDLCEAEDKGYRRGLAEGKRLARSAEAAD